MASQTLHLEMLEINGYIKQDMEKEVIKDFGSINCPESWDDITLIQYEKIEEYYSDKDNKFDVLDVIDIFIDKDKDYVMSLPAEFLEIILNKLSFLQTPPKTDKPDNKITIDGETYIINTQEKLKLGEYTSVDNIMKENKHDYASILAVLCRKDGEIYDSKFEAEVFESRKEMFEKQPVTKILSLIGFFINCYMILEVPTLLFSKVEEEANHILQAIKNSTNLGVFKKSYMIWQTKKCLKSIKSIKNT